MRKTWKKATAITLAGVTAMSMAACGGSSDKKESTSSTTEDGKPVISMMVPAFYGTELQNEHSDEVIKKYEDYTGVSVEWKFENDGTYKEKLGLTLMDKDNMPMILTSNVELSANIVDAAKKGAFWDLTSYLEDSEAYPNLSQADPEVSKALTVDGQIIGLYRARAKGRLGLSYRKDWAEKVGITEDPKTIEDVYEMLYKFTYEDPDGNGVDDTYGLELTKYTGPLDVIQTWFGTGNEWVEEKGKMVPVHQTEEYQEALDWMKKIYDEGLVRKDWATIDSGTFQEACKKGETGVFVDVMDGGTRIWDYFKTNNITSVVDSSKTATMQLVGPIEEKTLATSGYNGFYMITKAGAKTEEDLKNCLTFLDKMCDDEMMVLADYELEDISYTINENGNIEKSGDFEMSSLPNTGLNQAEAYIPNLLSQSPSLEMDEVQKARYESYEYNEPFAVSNPALGYLANSEVNAEVGTDIEQIIEDARTQYICGQIDKKGLEDAAQLWLDRGGDRLVEEVNELYKADK